MAASDIIVRPRRVASPKVFVLECDDLPCRQEMTVISGDRFREGTRNTGNGKGRFSNPSACAGVFCLKRNPNLDKNGIHFGNESFNSASSFLLFHVKWPTEAAKGV